MFRSVLVLIVAVLAFFGVLAVIVLIGSMRLRSDWASAGAPVDATAIDKPSETAPSNDPDSAPDATIDAGTNSGPATEPAAADPASIYLPAERAVLIGKVKLVDHRNDEANKPKPPAATTPAGADVKKRQRDGRRDRSNLDNKVWIAGLRSHDDAAQWPVSLQAAGKYEIDLIYGCASPMGGPYTVEIGGQLLAAQTQFTPNPNSFRVVTVGVVTLPAGATTLVIKPTSDAHQTLMNLKGAKLVPAL